VEYPVVHFGNISWSVMRILAVVPNLYDTSPGQRFRIEQWDPLLRERGVEITYAPFECEELHRHLYKSGNLRPKVALVTRAVFRRWSLLKSIRNYDVAYIFREAALFGPPVFENRIYRAGVPIVFDFDDAIFLSYRSPSNGYLSYLKFATKTKSVCRIAAHVTVGNPHLAQFARQFNPNVTVIPTTIDTQKYRVERTDASSLPVIGWTGSYSTVQHLDTLRSALRKLGEREKFMLRVIGTPQYKLEGLEVEAVPWRAETEIEDLRPVDIGVMPLPDDEWSKGKCGLKALQFMALGIPTVCSPVGVNTEIVHNGVNGMIAASEDEWIGALSSLLRSTELRARLGAAGRSTVEERYSAVSQVPRFHKVLESAAQKAEILTRGASADPRQKAVGLR
jgi:glycosyltransferase involved in cell wall biosynthesis